MRAKDIRFFIFWISILYYPCSAAGQEKPSILAFTSDTQAPLFVEKLYLKTNNNEKATELIFKDVAAVRPSALFILGDVVSLSYQEAKWKKMDTYFKWCANDSIPVYAAFGNHEFLIDAAKGRRNFMKRFPMASFTGYSEIVDSVAVLLFNSNFSKMTAAEITKQENWYNNTVKEMDNNPAIKFIIVGCHHSPYTNSKIVSPSGEVQRKYVPGFINSKKCILFLSGHSHNFEQFKVQGKYFFVIGGGGGPHQPVYTGNKEITYDLSSAYKPMFFYLEVIRNQDSMQVKSRELKSDFSGFNDKLILNVTK